ncbi:MAG: hypothetical protein PVF83_17370 [Anaerolineales bacterium]|jgi:hypothetical protein
MEKNYRRFILIPIVVLLLLLAACGSTNAQFIVTQTQIALEIFQTLTAEAAQTQIELGTFQTQTAEGMQTKIALEIFQTQTAEAIQTQIEPGIYQTQTAEAIQTQIEPGIYQTQTAEVMLTFTPLSIFTSTPSSTPKPTDTPTSMPGFCNHVDLNGRYVDHREKENYMYGWIMDVEQVGCQIIAYEFSYILYKGIESAGDTVELTGTINNDRLTVCYTSTNYCVPLVIFGGGQTLANGIEHWQYDKVEN